jgi:hypothetical protein
VLPDRALCLPTFSHFLNKAPALFSSFFLFHSPGSLLLLPSSHSYFCSTWGEA